MLIPIFHVIACVALMVAAIRCKRVDTAPKGAYRALLPFGLVAGVVGLVLVVPDVIEPLVAYWRGSLFEMEVMSYRLHGPYWWVFGAGAILPLLPLLGLFRVFGSRPLWMVAVAMLALLPVLFTPAVNIIRSVVGHAETAGMERSRG